MKKILITPPFSLPLYIFPSCLWILGWKLFDPYIQARMHFYSGAEHDGEPFALALAHVSKYMFGTPIIVVFICFVLCDYPGSVALLAWNHKKKWLSIFWTALFLLMSFFSILETQEMFLLHLPINTLASLSWIYLYLAFRSIMVEKTKRRKEKIGSSGFLLRNVFNDTNNLVDEA